MITNFFKPDDIMSKFIIELADNKTIVDIGCGTGHVLSRLKENGCENFVGFEPFTPSEYMNRNVIHRVIPREVSEDFTYQMLSKIADKSIVTLCRPCHHPELIFSTYMLCKKLNIQMYYIGLKKNVHRDLDMYRILYDLIPHQGSSAENEIILKIKI